MEENKLDVKNSANKKIDQKTSTKINKKNLMKGVGIIVAIIFGIVIIGKLLFSGGGDKKETEDNEFTQTPVSIEESRLGGNYEGNDREQKVLNQQATYQAEEKEIIDDIEEEPEVIYNYEEPENKAKSRLDQYLEDMEFEKLKRYYDAKVSPFNTISPKMSGATSFKTTDEAVGVRNGSTNNSYQFNPYDSMLESMGKSDPNYQKQKNEWVKQAAVSNFINTEFLTPSISRYEVKTGTFIPILLTFELISDIPGKVTAIVRENVYDSVTGDFLLIPMGTKLYGEYNSELSWGQERVQVKFLRMTLPNGKSMKLGTNGAGMIAGSQLGQSGLTGKVDMRLSKVIGSVVMAAAVGGASGVLSNDDKKNDDSTTNKALNGAGEESGTQTVTVINNYAEKILNVQPRITVPLGTRGTFIVTEDLILEEYDPKVEYLNKFN